MNTIKIPGQITLVDGDTWKYMLPLTFTRPVSDIRIGLLTILDKWQAYAENKPDQKSSEFFPTSSKDPNYGDQYWIHAGLLPNEEIVKEIQQLEHQESLYFGEEWLATHGVSPGGTQADLETQGVRKQVQTSTNVRLIKRPWHILNYLQEEILLDYQRLTVGRQSAVCSSTNRILGGHPVFVEEGAKAECVIFNTTGGPIYLGKGSEVMEGSMIRGPFLLGEGSTINMGGKMYGPTAIGPKCKVGGEVKGVQFFGNANKGHDGFLGDSILGEWCNLGADTNSSNLKNNYLPVRVWSYVEERFVDTGLQFCGLIMGDHSKTGINTMLNTGTVVGAYTNIFGEGYPRTFIPSFSWGGASGFSSHPLKKAVETAEIVMSRRNKNFSETDKQLAEKILAFDASYRSWEKNE